MLPSRRGSDAGLREPASRRTDGDSDVSFITRWLRSRRGECQVCGIVLRASTLPTLTGTAGSIHIEFSHLPVLACPSQGHPMRFTDTDFGANLIDRLFHKGDLPITDSARCGACKAALQAPNLSPGRVSGEVRVDRVAPFTMAVTAPLSRCPYCGLEQLVADDSVSSDLSDAMIAAFESARLSS